MDTKRYRLSKSDLKLYLDCPRHLWARAHGQLNEAPTELETHFFNEGMHAESLAQEYLRTYLLPQHPDAFLSTQQGFSDGPFFARVDALLCGLQGGGCALIEIKSSTKIDKEDRYDAIFQALILKEQCDLRKVYILHLDKSYRRGQDLDLQNLFKLEEIDFDSELANEVRGFREAALAVALNPDLLASEACYDPRNCPCPDLCHPNLPTPSIYEIPRILKAEKRKLRASGWEAIADLPLDHPLNEKQRIVAQVLREGKAYLNLDALRERLESLSWPLWFLDYETCKAAVPRYPGYGPQQDIVFQYSLHKLQAPHAIAEHFEALCLGPDEPSLALANQLREELGEYGSVIVWHETFEMGRNRELAELHPRHAAFLEGVNERVFDLEKIIADALYWHPDFKGSSSIKYVLPVMLPAYSYTKLNIQHGGQATAAWQRTCDPLTPAEDREVIRNDLLAYCHLDSLAMLEIYRRLRSLAGMDPA